MKRVGEGEVRAAAARTTAIALPSIDDRAARLVSARRAAARRATTGRAATQRSTAHRASSKGDARRLDALACLHERVGHGAVRT